MSNKNTFVFSYPKFSGEYCYCHRNIIRDIDEGSGRHQIEVSAVFNEKVLFFSLPSCYVIMVLLVLLEKIMSEITHVDTK